MSARPILFSGPMVRALLEGRKTQTRRAIKAPTACGGFVLSFNHGIPEFNFGPDDRKPNGDLRWHRCPYGQPGDLVWVRETFAAWWVTATKKRSHVMGYRADIDDPDWDGFGHDDPWWLDAKWEPSIHMPRSFSRLTLRITDVRVQRLQDISEDDAIAEGVDVGAMNAANCASFRAGTHNRLLAFEYRSIWNSINGPGSWNANPWVWALTFAVIKSNVSEVTP